MAKYKLDPSVLLSGLVLPILVLVIGIGAYFVLLPKYRATQTVKQTLLARQTEVQTHESQLTSVKSLVAELEKEKTTLAPVDEALPNAAQIPELLANFDYLTQQSGIFLVNIQLAPAPTLSTLAPGQTVSQAQRLQSLLSSTKQLGVLQASLKLKGTYGNLKTFLLGVERNLRLMDVQSVVITTAGDQSATQDYLVIIQTYYQKQ